MKMESKKRELNMYGLYDSATDSLIKSSICHSIEAAKGYAVWNYNNSFDDLQKIGLSVVDVMIIYTPLNDEQNG